IRVGVPHRKSRRSRSAYGERRTRPAAFTSEGRGSDVRLRGRARAIGPASAQLSECRCRTQSRRHAAIELRQAPGTRAHRLPSPRRPFGSRDQNRPRRCYGVARQLSAGGEGEIRTPERLAPLPVFKSWLSQARLLDPPRRTPLSTRGIVRYCWIGPDIRTTGNELASTKAFRPIRRRPVACASRDFHFDRNEIQSAAAIPQKGQTVVGSSVSTDSRNAASLLPPPRQRLLRAVPELCPRC